MVNQLKSARVVKKPIALPSGRQSDGSTRIVDLGSPLPSDFRSPFALTAHPLVRTVVGSMDTGAIMIVTTAAITATREHSRSSILPQERRCWVPWKHITNRPRTFHNKCSLLVDRVSLLKRARYHDIRGYRGRSSDLYDRAGFRQAPGVCSLPNRHPSEAR
jgi:hypothetical protein